MLPLFMPLGLSVDALPMSALQLGSLTCGPGFSQNAIGTPMVGIMFGGHAIPNGA